MVITIPPEVANSLLPYSSKASIDAALQKISAVHQHDSSSATGKLKNPGDGTVNINTADATELQRLPGVGPAMATRILAERAALGRFSKAGDLREVRGIGTKKYAKMAPFVVAD